MKTAIKINLANGMVVLSDGSEKSIDNYILELEDRLVKVQESLKDYGDIDPWEIYKITGEQLFQIMDAVEGK